MTCVCKCPKGLDTCPTPYTCGIYHLEGQQLDLAEEDLPSELTPVGVALGLSAFVFIVVCMVVLALVVALSRAMPSP